MSFKTKIALLASVSVLSMSALSAAMLYNMRQDLTEIRRSQIQSVTESLHGVIKGFQSMADAGLVPVSDAKKAAIEVVKNAQYNSKDGESGSFFLLSKDGIAIRHINEALIGTDVRTRYKFGEGRMPFEEILNGVKGKRSAFVETSLPKPGSNAPVDKLEYVMGLDSWGWIIGTGAYVDDIQQEFEERAFAPLVFVLILIGVQVGLAVWVSSDVLRQLGADPAKLLDFMSRVANGDLGAAGPPARRGSLFAAIADAIDSVRHITQSITVAPEDPPRSDERVQDTSPSLTLTTTVKDQPEALLSATVQELSILADDISGHAGNAAKRTVGALSMIEENVERMNGVTFDIKTIAVRINGAADCLGAIETRADEVAAISEEIKRLSEKAAELVVVLEMPPKDPVAASERVRLAEGLSSSLSETASLIETRINSIQWGVEQIVAVLREISPKVTHAEEASNTTVEKLQEMRRSTMALLENIREMTAAIRKQRALGADIPQRVN